MGENPISLQEWLKNIFESEFVVTDSFHGCVFSMIFHKHFYCFINEKRGGDRFNSLLEMVDLKDRIIIEGNFVNKNINFNEVDKKLSKMREISTKFLLNSLND